jgi:hypothetical protein
VYNVQSKKIKMRRDKTVVPAMPQKERHLRGVQEEFQVEAIRRGYIREQTICAEKGETEYAIPRLPRALK